MVFCLALLLTTGCKKDDITNAVQPVALIIQVHYDKEQQLLNLPLNEVTVKISNTINGQVYTASTDEKGGAAFSSVVPGNYQLSASKVIKAQDYKDITGIPTQEDVSLNATANITIAASGTQDLTLAAGRIGNLVFKQIYYAGSNGSKGASFRDQFVEIYNNSNDTIYADSLYIGNSHANQKTVNDGAKSFDWSQSIGMNAGGKDPNKDFVYLENLFMIPGSGKDHPIAPGESIVIAATALNHQRPYTNNSGKQISITDPTLTVDLSHADFEVYLVDYLRDQSGDPSKFTPFASDLDNPDVPNLVIYAAADKDWVLDATGRDDFIMFKTATPITSFPSYPDPTVTEVTVSTEKFKQIPISTIIDAVEITNPISTKRIPKRLPSSLDGEATFVLAGQYSSQSLIRKIAKTVGDRIIFQDTNNSANDFDTKQKADPSKSASSFTKD